MITPRRVRESSVPTHERCVIDINNYCFFLVTPDPDAMAGGTVSHPLLSNLASACEPEGLVIESESKYDPAIIASVTTSMTPPSPQVLDDWEEAVELSFHLNGSHFVLDSGLLEPIIFDPCTPEYEAPAGPGSYRAIVAAWGRWIPCSGCL